MDAMRNLVDMIMGVGYNAGLKRPTRLNYDLQVHAARSIADVGSQGSNAKTIVHCG